MLLLRNGRDRTGITPTLGRFAQADSIVPGGSALAFDRYAYVLHSPLNATDPSGHCIFGLDTLFCVAAAVVGGIVAGVVTYDQIVEPALGREPDYVGLSNVDAYMDPSTDSILVAAGIAVQSQWSGTLDMWIGNITPGPSGYGLAQTNAEEIASLQASGDLAGGNYNPLNANDAVQVMQARISSVLGVCDDRCTGIDRVILAALAQNRSMGAEEARSMMSKGFKWENYFKDAISGEQLDARFREGLSGMDYKNLILLKYTLNLRELYRRGWDLPYGITPADLDYLEKLAKGE